VIHKSKNNKGNHLTGSLIFVLDCCCLGCCLPEDQGGGIILVTFKSRHIDLALPNHMLSFEGRCEHDRFRLEVCFVDAIIYAFPQVVQVFWTCAVVFEVCFAAYSQPMKLL
jgi:hypothetical protein